MLKLSCIKTQNKTYTKFSFQYNYSFLRKFIFDYGVNMSLAKKLDECEIVPDFFSDGNAKKSDRIARLATPVQVKKTWVLYKCGNGRLCRQNQCQKS